MLSRTIADLRESVTAKLNYGIPRASAVVPGRYAVRPVLIEFGSDDNPHEIGIVTLVHWDDHPQCPWVVEQISVKKEWESVVYDYLMEFATVNGGGLTPNPRINSLVELCVWNRLLRAKGNGVELLKLNDEYRLDGFRELRHIYRKSPPVTMDALRDRTVGVTVA